jgi:hypothetical protein
MAVIVANEIRKLCNGFILCKVRRLLTVNIPFDAIFLGCNLDVENFFLKTVVHGRYALKIKQLMAYNTYWISAIMCIIIRVYGLVENTDKNNIFCIDTDGHR